MKVYKTLKIHKIDSSTNLIFLQHSFLCVFDQFILIMYDSVLHAKRKIHKFHARCSNKFMLIVCALFYIYLKLKKCFFIISKDKRLRNSSSWDSLF